MKKNSQGKKLISLALAFALLISLFSILPLTASAAVGDTEVVDGITYKVTAESDSAHEATVSAFDINTTTSDVKIKDKVNIKGTDYTVSTIGTNVFAAKKITSISIPETIKIIKDSSFYNSTDLKDVYIYGAPELGGDPFWGCKALENLYFYNNKIILGSNVLSKSGLNKKNFKIHGHTGSTAETFAKTKSYTFVALDEEGTKATTETTATTATAAPQTTAAPTTVDPNKPKTGDTTVIDGVKYQIYVYSTLDPYAEVVGFDDSTTDVKIQETVNIKGTDFPVTKLNAKVLQGNENITSVSIPKELKSIDGDTFKGCTALKDVYIYSNCTFVLYPFTDCSSLENAYCYADKITFGGGFDKSNLDRKKFKVHGHSGSTAETLAIKFGYTFVDLDGTKPVETTVLAETTVATEATTVGAEPTEATTIGAEPTEATTVAADTTAPIDLEDNLVLLGDADSSGKVDVKDVTHIQKHIASYFTLEGKAALAADVDGSGVIDVNDVTLIQKYLADFNVDYKIGEVVLLGSDTPVPTAENPQPTDAQPTDEQSTTAAPQPTDEQPTTAEPEPTDNVKPSAPDGTTIFYIPNYVSWLSKDGCKMWLYNVATDEKMAAEGYDENPDGIAGYFYFYLPNDWVSLSIYRTAFDITEEKFNKDSLWDEGSQTGIILNKWEYIGPREGNNAYRITADKILGKFETFDPATPKPSETERTIYFDNSKTKWSKVYIYGWNFGLSEEAVEMENEGNDIWSYTFYDTLPMDGVQGFLFTDRYTSKSSWTEGTQQTTDLATETGNDLFVPTPGKLDKDKHQVGEWTVYNPQ